jgi:hypothetical protein
MAVAILLVGFEALELLVADDFHIYVSIFKGVD